jgi:hypothetical protein
MSGLGLITGVAKGAVFNSREGHSEPNSEEKPDYQGHDCSCAVAHARIVAGRGDKAP